MIEFQPSTRYSSQNELLQYNQLGINGVNRSDLYASNTNASKNMSIYNNNDYNKLHNYSDEDNIYDFESNTHDQMLQQRYIEDPRYNYTDEEDEDEDINFDYEYGYDYERVIKDRLAKVNQDFVNDSEPPKRKSILVSFDNAVTAIDISIEEQQKLQTTNQINFLSSEEKMKFKAALESSQSAENNVVEENNVVKLPLNDTVQKDDPDHFANQVRIKNSMYDAQIQEHNNQMLEGDKQQSPAPSVNNSSENIRDEKLRMNHVSQDAMVKATIQPDNVNIIEQKYKSSTPSPQPDDSHFSDTETKPNSNNVPKSDLNEKYDSSDWADSTQTKSNDSIDQTQPVSETQKEKITAHNNRVISFSANSRHNVESPSPISSSRSTPEPNKTETENETTSGGMKKSEGFNINFSETKEPHKDRSNMSATSERTLTEHSDAETTTGDKKANKSADTNTNDDQAQVEGNTEERILVEKDGVFALMTTQEHTAYEKQKKKERKQQNLSLNSTINSCDQSGSKPPTNPSSGENDKPQASPITILPHPPPRKTKNTKPRPKSSYISRQDELGRKNSLRTRFELETTTTSNQTSQRSAHSADPGSRLRATSARSCTGRTPDYASDYRSPYKQTCKIVRVGETAEEKKRRERAEEQEKKAKNEMAFSCWLKMKEEQKASKQLRMANKAGNNEAVGNGTLTTGNSDDRVTFDAWLQKKTEQLQHERDFKKTLDQYQINETTKKQTPDERNRAYKEWLNRKNKEKMEALKQDKLEMRKWSSKRRRSRKHQRLSQALELAQAYGYNSSYRSPGPFTF